ncbi:MAG: hypothetical protein V1694_01180 [Candidatus Eisenbacteria bacterium]
MSLEQWAADGWIKAHRPSQQEIKDLLQIADRDAKDASSGSISADWRFGIAYNAALKLATILLAASGYRVGRARHHQMTLQAIPLILGPVRKADAAYLENCSRRRNAIQYDSVGGVTGDDVAELLEFVGTLREDVVAWLRDSHRDLVPPGIL